MCIITDRYLLILFVLGHGLVTAPRPHPWMVSDQKYLFDCEYTRRLGGPRAGSCGPRTLRHEEISIKIFSNSCSPLLLPRRGISNHRHRGHLLFRISRHQLCLWCPLPVNRELGVWSDFAAKLAEQEFIGSSTQLTRLVGPGVLLNDDGCSERFQECKQIAETNNWNCETLL